MMNLGMRPYCKSEIKDERERTTNRFRLSKKFVHHDRCNHTYRVKINSRKERDIYETKDGGLAPDVGNCSVCWKLKNEWDVDEDMIEDYQSQVKSAFEGYAFVVAERSFYAWLYGGDM
jgi:hypothetical protein